MILKSILDFIEGLFASITWDYIFFIGIGFEVLLAIFFIIKSTFSYEMRIVRKLSKLNNWLNKNQYINANNLLAFNNLMKKTPKLFRYYWHQYMLYRDKEPSKYMSMYNLIEKPLKTSSFIANIKDYIGLSCAFAGLVLFFGIVGSTGNLEFSAISQCIATPFIMLFVAVIFVMIMRSRQNQNLNSLYQYLHYYNRFMDKAVTTMPDYVDFEVLFTRKEIKKGISVLNEYLEKRARQEQEELEKARLNAVEHENFDFTKTGIDGALVLERAMKETETYLNIRNRMLTEIQQLEEEIESIKRNYENTQKDYQKKMQVSKENVDRLRKQQEETTNRIENNYIKKQQADEIKKQEQLEKDNDNATLRFNQELETLTTEIQNRRKELEEKRQYVEDAMKAEYQTFSTKMYKSVYKIAEDKNQADKDELLSLKDEIAGELDKANQQILEKDSEIKDLKNIIEKNNISVGENGGFFSKKLQKETKRVKRGKKNKPIDENDSDLIYNPELDEEKEQIIEEVEQPVAQEEITEEQVNETQPIETETEQVFEANEEQAGETQPEEITEIEENAQPEENIQPENNVQADEEYREYGEDGGWFDKDGYYRYDNGAYFDLEGRFFDEFGGWYEADGVTYHEPEVIRTEDTLTDEILDPTNDEEYREYGGDGGWFDKDGYYRYENGAYFDPEGRYFDEFGGWFEVDGITYHEPENPEQAQLAEENQEQEPIDELYDDIKEEKAIDREADQTFENVFGESEEEISNKEISEIVLPESNEPIHLAETPEQDDNEINEEDFDFADENKEEDKEQEEVINIPEPKHEPLSEKVLSEIAKLKQQFAIDDDLFLDENDKPIEVELDENGAYFDSEGNYVYPNKGWYDPKGNFHDENGGWYDAKTKEYHEPEDEKPQPKKTKKSIKKAEENEITTDDDKLTTTEISPIKNEVKDDSTEDVDIDLDKIFEDDEQTNQVEESLEENIEVLPKKKAGRPKKVKTEKENDKPIRKAGRPRKEKIENEPKKQRGRPKKIKTETETLDKPVRKAGRPKKEKTEKVEKIKKAGRPKKVAEPNEKTTTKKKAGRPKKSKEGKEVIKKAGRPKKEKTDKETTGKRGRPKLAEPKDTKLTLKKKAGRPKKEKTEKVKKAGRPKKAVEKPAKRPGRPKKSELNELEKLNKQIENENKKLAKHQEQLNKQLDKTLSQLTKKKK